MPSRIDKRKKQQLENLKASILPIMIFLLIIVTIFFIRTNYFYKIAPHQESYYHFRLAKESTDDFMKLDEYIIPKRPYFNELFYILMNKISNINKDISTILPFILVIVSSIFLSLIINEFFKNKKIKNKKDSKYYILIANLFFVTSPILIFLTFTFNPIILTITLLTIFSYIILKFDNSTKKKQKRKYAILAILATILLSITSPEKYTTILLLFVMFFFTFKKKSTKQFYVILFPISLITFLSFAKDIILETGLRLFLTENIYQNLYLIEMGSLTGIRIVDLILIIFAIGLLWNKKQKYYLTSLTLMTLLVLSLKYKMINKIMIPIYSILCAYSLFEIIKRKWDITYLKKLTLTLIITFFIIFTAQYIINFSFSEPNIGKNSGIRVLSSSTIKTEGAVLSSPENGHMIQLLAKRKVFIDNNLDYLKNPKEKMDLFENIMKSRDINDILNLSKTDNINFIMVDNEMKEKYWDNKVDGLYFIIKNSKKIEQIYRNREIEVYYINKEDK